MNYPGGILSGPAVLSNIYHPVHRPKPAIAEPATPKVSATELSGIALADTLSILDQRVQVTLGLRKQNVQSTTTTPPVQSLQPMTMARPRRCSGPCCGPGITCRSTTTTSKA